MISTWFDIILRILAGCLLCQIQAEKEKEKSASDTRFVQRLKLIQKSIPGWFVSGFQYLCRDNSLTIKCTNARTRWSIYACKRFKEIATVRRRTNDSERFVPSFHRRYQRTNVFCVIACVQKFVHVNKTNSFEAVSLVQTISLPIESNLIVPSCRPPRAKTVNVKQSRFYSANNAGSLASQRRFLFSSVARSLHLLCSSVSLSLTFCFSSRLFPTHFATWLKRRRAEFLSPHCVSQGCCHFCSPIVRIHQRIHSFRSHCLAAVLA